MEVIVIRHSLALPADKAREMGLSDGERPLTTRGDRHARSAAAGLRYVLAEQPLDAVLTSPLLRARQTAAILAQHLDDPPIDEAEVLAPGQPMEAVDAWLHAHFGERRLLLVGHEPDLANWVSWGLTRQRHRLLTFKEAGSALLRFPGAPEGGTGTLHWCLTADQLHTLGTRHDG